MSRFLILFNCFQLNSEKSASGNELEVGGATFEEDNRRRASRKTPLAAVAGS